MVSSKLVVVENFWTHHCDQQPFLHITSPFFIALHQNLSLLIYAAMWWRDDMELGLRDTFSEKSNLKIGHNFSPDDPIGKIFAPFNSYSKAASYRHLSSIWKGWSGSDFPPDDLARIFRPMIWLGFSARWSGSDFPPDDLARIFRPMIWGRRKRRRWLRNFESCHLLDFVIFLWF